MKKFLFSMLLAFALFSFNPVRLHSQNLIVEYNMNIDISEKLKEIKNPIIRRMVKKQMSKPIKYELKISNGISIYQQAQIDNNTENGNVTMKVNSNNSILFKNQKTQLLIEQREYKSRLFLIKEQLVKYDWEMTNEKVKIGDYICTKAILNTEDKTIVAWFSPEIPISDGPIGYYGLPGLIMKLTDKIATYEVAKITPVKEALNIEEPRKGKKVTREEFNKIKEQKEQNEEKTEGGVQVIVKEY